MRISENGSPDGSGGFPAASLCSCYKRALKILLKIANDFHLENAPNHPPSVGNQVKNQLFCQRKIESSEDFDLLTSSPQIYGAFSVWRDCLADCREHWLTADQNTIVNPKNELFFEKLPESMRELIATLESEYQNVKNVILKEIGRD